MWRAWYTPDQNNDRKKDEPKKFFGTKFSKSSGGRGEKKQSEPEEFNWKRVLRIVLSWSLIILAVFIVMSVFRSDDAGRHTISFNQYQEFLRQNKIKSAVIKKTGSNDFDFHGTLRTSEEMTNTSGVKVTGDKFVVTLPYTNIDDEITSWGGGATFQYQLPQNFLLDLNYSYADFDAVQAQKNNPEFVPAFNTPKHRFQAGLSNKEVVKGKGIGFNLRFRWSDGYLWQSPFGQGAIESYQVVDASLTYKIPAARSLLKLGANNLFNREYRQIYGGPNVGSHYYISLTFDDMFR